MAISVKNLIEELQKLDPEDYVVLSSDQEGNTYNFLEGIAINQRLNNGGVFLPELTPELEEEGYTPEDVCEEGVPCVVFYPGVDTTLLETILSASKPKEQS